VQVSVQIVLFVSLFIYTMFITNKNPIHEPTSYYYESLVRYQATASDRSPAFVTVLKFALFNMIYSAALFFGAFPMPLQCAILEMLQPLVFAGIILTWVAVSSSLPAIIIGSTLTVGIGGYLLHRGYQFASGSASVVTKAASKGRLGVVLPIDKSADTDEFIDLQLDWEEDNESSADSSCDSRGSDAAQQPSVRASVYSCGVKCGENPFDAGQIDYSLSLSDSASNDSRPNRSEYAISFSSISVSDDCNHCSNPYDAGVINYEISSVEEESSEEDDFLSSNDSSGSNASFSGSGSGSGSGSAQG